MSLADLTGFADLLVGQLFAGQPVDVHVGAVPSVDDKDMPRRYVLILGGPTFDVQERLTASLAPRTVTPIVHAYARTWQEAQWLADAVDAVLRPNGWGRTPVVAGRSCDRLVRDAALSAEVDGTGQPPWWHAISEYSFRSRPA